MENNEREFARIVRENKRRIYTVCYMFSKDTEQVNDLFQDILINIWNGLKSFEGEKRLSTWIWKVSLNTCINYTKKKKKDDEKSIILYDFSSTGVDADSFNMDIWRRYLKSAL